MYLTTCRDGKWCMHVKKFTEARRHDKAILIILNPSMLSFIKVITSAHSSDKKAYDCTQIFSIQVIVKIGSESEQGNYQEIWCRLA